MSDLRQDRAEDVERAEILRQILCSRCPKPRQDEGVNDMEETRPGYYAVIPADVRYDDNIPPNAKLLYGEISALIGADGFCYASNQYFAKIYGMNEDTITRLISKLEKAGYIIRELERDNSGQIVRRKLFLSVSIPDVQPVDNLSGTLPDKKSGGTGQKAGYTNLSNTNNTPYSPPQGTPPTRKSKREPKAAAETLPKRFEGFWQFYRSRMPEGCNAGNRQKAIRAWDKLAPDEALVTTMANALWKQVNSKAWASGVGVPHASTWLNNRGWEDDWGSGKDQPKQEPGRGNEVWL